MTRAPGGDRLHTNRDIYLAITKLIVDFRSRPPRGLEEYLRALLRECRSRKHLPALATAEFLTVLERAFSTEPLAYDPAWAVRTGDRSDDPGGFASFEATLLRQIAALHQMREQGLLDSKGAEFGVDGPGGRWYNLEPRSYLECATQGTIGGWEPGDPTGRVFVPGEVAVLDASGQVTSADPRSLPRRIYPVDHVTWELFSDFLMCGQMYE
jgi:hypothetical protein